MFKLEDLHKGTVFEELPLQHQHNIEELLAKISRLAIKYNKPMIITSCYRSIEHHLAIYAKKGITDKSKIPLKSAHLSGCAVDIGDEAGTFYSWCKSNEATLKDIGFWLENRQGSWQHLQIRPFASYKDGGTIWFNP